MTIFDVHKKRSNELFVFPNVVSVAIGQKKQQGKSVNRIAIVVSVKKKIPESELRLNEIIPKYIEGFETDVVESGGTIIPLHGS